MPFTGTQTVLKKILSDRCFRLLYNIANYIYNAVVRVIDEAYYAFSYVFFLFTGNTASVRKIKLILSIRPYTMVGRNGLLATYEIASGIEKDKIPGCFIECGVARGGCSALMAMVARENKSRRKTWLFDSFEGLPEPTPEDEFSSPVRYEPEDKHSDLVVEGYCLGTYEEVEDLLFGKLGLNREDVFMIKGWFQDTLPEYRDKVGDVSILRIDGDWYESTKCCLDNLYDNVVPGGYVIIDDYAGFIGCKKATDEFIENRNLDVKLVFDNRGGCYFKKP